MVLIIIDILLIVGKRKEVRNHVKKIFTVAAGAAKKVRRAHFCELQKNSAQIGGF